MLNTIVYTGELTPPIQSLEDYFRKGGVSIIQAAFAHSYFVHPDKVRAKTPYFPDRARYSRQHYPGLAKGQQTAWPGDGREIRLDDNQYAQNAWAQYTGRNIERRTGYSLRHIWGNTHRPGCVHSRLEFLLYAILGRYVDGRSESSPGTTTGHLSSIVGTLLSRLPRVSTAELR